MIIEAKTASKMICLCDIIISSAHYSPGRALVTAGMTTLSKTTVLLWCIFATFGNYYCNSIQPGMQVCGVQNSCIKAGFSGRFKSQQY